MKKIDRRVARVLAVVDKQAQGLSRNEWYVLLLSIANECEERIGLYDEVKK